jgi:acyl-CoA thioesterase-2
VRAKGRLPDDPAIHQCVLAYASDMTLLSNAVNAHPVAVTSPGFQSASLDHAMWFHRPARADEWLLFDQVSPSASGGRGLASGRLFTHDGRLAVSVVQEGLIRLRRS